MLRCIRHAIKSLSAKVGGHHTVYIVCGFHLRSTASIGSLFTSLPKNGTASSYSYLSVDLQECRWADRFSPCFPCSWIIAEKESIRPHSTLPSRGGLGPVVRSVHAMLIYILISGYGVSEYMSHNLSSSLILHELILPLIYLFATVLRLLTQSLHFSQEGSSAAQTPAVRPSLRSDPCCSQRGYCSTASHRYRQLQEMKVEVRGREGGLKEEVHWMRKVSSESAPNACMCSEYWVGVGSDTYPS